MQAADDAPRNKIVLGILFMLLAGLFSSLMQIGVRYATPYLPSIQIAAIRSVFTLFLTLPVVMLAGERAWRTNRLDLQVLAGCVGVAGVWSWYYALGHMPLADAGALSFTTGLFVALGAAFFRERIGIRRWAAIVVGFLGAVIILRPGAGVISWPAIWAVTSSALWGGSLLFTKYMANFDRKITVLFYQPLMMAPLALLLAVPTWTWPDLHVVAILAGIGFVSAVGNYCYIHALSLAEASLLMSADYVRLVWMAGWGFFFFAEVPLQSTWIGAVLIIGATGFITWRESRIANAALPQQAGPICAISPRPSRRNELQI